MESVFPHNFLPPPYELFESSKERKIPIAERKYIKDGVTLICANGENILLLVVLLVVVDNNGEDAEGIGGAGHLKRG